MEWYDYKHLDWISVRRDDDQIYKFKEGDFKRLRLQDIEDMLLLLVQGKLSNLTVEERLTFNVSFRMFTRSIIIKRRVSIVIKRRVEDLQLGVESYQKRLNLTKPDTYRPYLRRRKAYTAHSNPRGFIYQNKDKKNRLMRIDELHKFSDGTLNDVRNALDNRLKGIRMQYLPLTIWRKGDKDIAAAMIQAIKKMLKTRRIMRSLEKFVGGRLDETLNDVRNALDDRLKGIRMQYLLTTIWRKGDKDRAVAMIQAIDKMLKTRRIMRSLERMFTRSIVIQRRVEDLQLGLKSYQKRLNLTNLDTYRSDLKQREADETLNDVRNALDDRLKGIRMQYLLTTIWRKGDKDRAVAMIQAIDKMLKTRRIMRSLERFVGGRIYEGDFQMLQRTI
nr:hypothetical protein [Tanacetum cinerariifolium]